MFQWLHARNTAIVLQLLHYQSWLKCGQMEYETDKKKKKNSCCIFKEIKFELKMKGLEICKYEHR